MAAPHVSGAAALVLSRCQLDTTSLKNILLNNVDPVASLSAITVTGGRLNVNKALLGCDDGFRGLSLTMADSADPVTTNVNLTYTLTVTNKNSSAYTGVALTDTLPSGVTFVSASSSQGTCSGSSTINCALGELASGATATATIVVKPTAPGTITNTATVAGNETDSNPGDNTAMTTTTVVGSLGPLTLNPTTVVGSQLSVATVTLNEPAPASGAIVKLTTSNSAVAVVPGSITLAAGTTSKTFAVTSRAVATTSTVDIIASYNAITQTAKLTVEPASLSGLTVNVPTLNPCQTSAARVTLNAAAPVGGAVVTLTSSNGAVIVPTSITVPAGTTGVNFTVTPTAVSSTQTSTITASYRGVSMSKPVTVTPIVISVLGLTPNPVTGPNSVTGTVTLTCPAPSGGQLVSLSTNASTIARPTVSSITIAAGSKTGTFTVTTADVTTYKNVNITATSNGASKTVSLRVN